MVQLVLTQEVTTLLNPVSKQRHVSLVDGHSDFGNEAARHSSYATASQYSLFRIECAVELNLHRSPASQSNPSSLIHTA